MSEKGFLTRYVGAAFSKVEILTREPNKRTKNPNAYVVKGYPKNVMPPFDLPGPQLDALVQYLADSSKKG